jgi:hypothetical protein
MNDARKRWRLSLRVVVAAVTFCLTLTATASAQNAKDEYIPSGKNPVFDKNLYFFTPPTDGSGLITAWGSEPIGHFGVHVGAIGDYSYRPMVYVDPNDTEHIVIYNQTGVNAMVGVGLWDALNISGAFVTTPNRSFNKTYFNIYKKSPDSALVWKENATGDARASVKYMLTNRRTDGLGVAFLGEATLGNGTAHNFVSDQQVTFAPRLIFDFGNEWYTYVLNVGYKIYPQGIEPGLFNIDTGNELLLNTGVTFRLFWGLELVGDLAARAYTGESDYKRAYSELFYAIRSTWMVRNPLRITIGGSAGLGDGVGTPITRFYGGFNFFFRELGLP